MKSSSNINVFALFFSLSDDLHHNNLHFKITEKEQNMSTIRKFTSGEGGYDNEQQCEIITTTKE